jgi:hypothetical protein
MDTRLTAPRKEKALETTIRREIEALRHMTVAQLKKKYSEVFGEENRIITRINGTYVRRGECELREELVHERLTAIADEVKNRNAAGL